MKTMGRWVMALMLLSMAGLTQAETRMAVSMDLMNENAGLMMRYEQGFENEGQQSSALRYDETIHEEAEPEYRPGMVAGQLQDAQTRPGQDYVWVGPLAISTGVTIPGYWRPRVKAGFVWVNDAWSGRGMFIPGHWRPVRAPQRNLVWVPGYWVNGYWQPGMWRPAQRKGFMWVPGHWTVTGLWVAPHWQPAGPAPFGQQWVPGYCRANGVWVPGYWRPASRQNAAWVNGHYGPNGQWIEGHWRRGAGHVSHQPAQPPERHAQPQPVKLSERSSQPQPVKLSERSARPAAIAKPGRKIKPSKNHRNDESRQNRGR